MIELFSNQFELYFVCSQRLNLIIDKKYHDYKNVLVFDYSELLETNEFTLKSIVDNMYNKLLNFLPKNINLSKHGAFDRITNMNKLYEQIKHLPFSYIDPFYQLHGSHRNRKNDF